MNKFRKKSLLMVVLILLIVIVSIVSLYFAYKVNKDKNSNDIENNNIINKNTNTANTEQEMVDTTRVYKSLDRSIAVISNLYTSLDNRITDIYKREINISDVEKNYKIYSVLLYLYGEKNYSAITPEDYNRLYEGLYMDEKKEYYGSIDMDDVSYLYKKEYNEDLGAGVEVSIENYCPTFKFDNNKYYFGTYDCKNVKSIIKDYKYKYVIGEDSADVYVALGVLEYDYNYKAYKYDLYKESFFKESETDLLLDINLKNYNEYSKYIVHFVTVNGDYYVNSVRKAMD